MRSRIIVLLAVCSNIAAAGPLRHNEAHVRHLNVARFLNNTGTPSIGADIQISTPIPISSSSIIPLIAAGPETSASFATSSAVPAATPLAPDVATSSSPAADTLTLSTLSQIFSTSATLSPTPPTTSKSERFDVASGATPVSTSALLNEGSPSSENQEGATLQPAETLSRLFNIVGTLRNDQQSSSSALSFSSMPSSRLSTSTTTNSEVQSAANTQNSAATVLSSSATNQVLSPSEVALPTSSTATFSQAMPFSTASVITSSPTAASQASSPVIIPVPISSGLVQVLGPGGDAADEWAPVTLDSSLPAPTANAEYPTAAGGNMAMATGFNKVYQTLSQDSPCNPGVPSQAYVCISGELAGCRSDGTYGLKSCPDGQSCYALPQPSDSVGVVVQCAVPSDASNVLHGLSSSTAVPAAVASQPVQLLQAEGDFSQATQSVSAQNPVQIVTSSSSAQTTFQPQTMTPSPSTLAVTATAQQVHDSPAVNNSPKLDISPPAPSITPDIYSVPKALFGVVTAPGNVGASTSENSAQASVAASQASHQYPGVSTPVIQSSTMSPYASPNSLQFTEAGVASTSTSSADGAGITSAQLRVPVNEKVAVGNGQATVTVTVTVTTTEKPAPVTIIASS